MACWSRIWQILTIVDLVSHLAAQCHSMGNLHQERADNMQVCTHGTLFCNNKSAVFNSTLNRKNCLLTMRDSLYSEYSQLNDYLEKILKRFRIFPSPTQLFDTKFNRLVSSQKIPVRVFTVLSRNPVGAIPN